MYAFKTGNCTLLSCLLWDIDTETQLGLKKGFGKHQNAKIKAH
jgi:hypothetical protein